LIEVIIVEKNGVQEQREAYSNVVDMKKWKKGNINNMTISLNDLARWRPGRLAGPVL
jgi:hypothetical protein